MSRALGGGGRGCPGLLLGAGVGVLALLAGCGPQEGIVPPNASDPSQNGGSGGLNELGTTTSLKDLPGASLFGDDQVLQIHLTLSPSDLEAIEERGNEETYVPAQLVVSGERIGELELGEVGVRHKGAYSLHHCWDDNGGARNYANECAKLSLKLKFNKYQDDQRLDGLKRLNLHSSSGDETRLHELIAYDAYRDFGVDAPRTAVAEVLVNGTVQGLFIAVESVDGRYTKAHYSQGGGDGNLYKEIWPSPQVEESAVVESLKTNEEEPNVAEFLAFANAMNDVTGQSVASDLAAWTDVDELLRYIAVDRALKNWDGIMAFYSPISPHNFYWYHDAEGSGLFHLVPWDMDNTLWEFDPYMSPAEWVTAEAVPDWNIEPDHCDPRSVWEADGGTRITAPRCDRLLDSLAEGQWSQFESLSNELLASSFSTARLLQRVKHFSDLIETILASDPFVDFEQWRQNRLAFEGTLATARNDFQQYVEGGLRTEGDPLPSPLPLSSEAGLLFAGGEGFESTGGGQPDDLGIYTYGSDLSNFSASFSRDGSLTGETDLRFDFSLQQEDGAWAEWVNLGVPTEGSRTVDIRNHSSIVVTLSADRARTVRVRLESATFASDFGGAWSEFGQDVQVTTEPKSFTLPLASFSYPDWARDAWTDGQGWTSTDAAALEQVRQRFTGLLFAPSAQFDPEGQLAEPTESGHLRVDALTVQ